MRDDDKKTILKNSLFIFLYEWINWNIKYFKKEDT
jgi:hypothetical protein